MKGRTDEGAKRPVMRLARSAVRAVRYFVTSGLGGELRVRVKVRVKVGARFRVRKLGGELLHQRR